MSKLKDYRELQHLTQEELAEKSGVSVRTIQRIEAGTPPKGHTLKTLAKALHVEEKNLVEAAQADQKVNYTKVKVINIATILFILFPPLNIIIPLLLMWIFKEYHKLSKQIVSIQIVWTIFSVIAVVLTALTRNWFWLPDEIVLIVMVILVLVNVFIILANAAKIDKENRLAIQLNFNVI